MTALQPINFIPEGPQPLVADIPPAAEYPVTALGALQAVAEGVADKTQAPIAIAAQSALAVASLAVQGHADVTTLGGPAPLSLFALTVAASGERKSGCDKLLTAAVKEHERGQVSIYRSDMADYDAASKLWEARQSRMIKEAAGKGDKAMQAAADLEAMPDRPTEPIAPLRIVADPTFDGLTKYLITGQPSVAILNDEGGSFVGGHAMNSDNKLRTVAGLSSLWDGSPINRTRAGDGVTTIYGKRLAAHLLIQPVAAAPLLSDPVANAQGFLARFLIAEPQSNIGFRLRRGHDPKSDAAISQFAARTQSILSEPHPLREGTQSELQPRLLSLSAEAEEMLFRYAEAVEKAQAPDGEYDGITPFASKSAEQACRIAGTLALFEDLNCQELNGEQMARGIALAGFYLSEAKRLTGAALIAEETAQAESLRRWLIDKWPDEFVSQRMIIQYGPNFARDAKVAAKLIAVLELNGWMLVCDEPVIVRGKTPKKAWRVVKC